MEFKMPIIFISYFVINKYIYPSRVIKFKSKKKSKMELQRLKYTSVFVRLADVFISNSSACMNE